MRLLLILTFIPGFVIGQCNGSFSLCNKTYNEVAYLTTHNAYNAQQENFSFPNQNFSITNQMNDGVRALMIDVHDLAGVPSVFHEFSFLGNAPLQSNLNEIKTFLDGNPNEVITLILECYVSSSVIESELITAGLYNYLYTKPAAGPWNTLGEMISANTRLVVLTDVDDAGVGQEWYHYAWDHCVETHYSVNNINDFTNDYNRGSATNDLFIFNHFLTSATTGTGLPNEASAVNDYNFLMSRIEGHYSEYSKFPNFITLDFYEIGEGMEVVDSLNSDSHTLSLIGLNDEIIVGNTQLIKITNLLGQEVEYKPNTPLIYIYSDGSTERVYNVE
jgi:hypothetical protein